MKGGRTPNATNQLLLISTILVVFKGFMIAGKASVKGTDESVGRLVDTNWVVVFNAAEMIISTALAVLAFFRIQILWILTSKAHVFICKDTINLTKFGKF